jgi:hypothetical protein
VNLDFFIGYGSPSGFNLSRKTLTQTGPRVREDTNIASDGIAIRVLRDLLAHGLQPHQVRRL